MLFQKEYWSNRWKNDQTGWDTGTPMPELASYFQGFRNKEMSVLIPGGGRGYEAEYLWNSGFKNVFLLDIAEKPLFDFKERVPEFPGNHLIQADFLKLEGQYDCILEYTFFCALDPELRKDYFTKTNALLSQNGLYIAALWSIEMNGGQPPFGGSLEEYMNLIEGLFDVIQIKENIHSIKPRQGKELFLELRKK